MATDKQHLSLVICGHLDSGKSTIAGRLLFEFGGIPEREMEMLRAEAERLGKPSCAFACRMDRQKEERERGVTIACTTGEFHTDKWHYTIINAPGRREFITNMITGASQADVALLMVPADGDFASAIARGNHKAGKMQGQTRQHARLINLLGVKQLVVGINKMDSGVAQYKQDRYNECKVQVKSCLIETGWEKQFVEECVPILPVSGWVGDNLVRRSENMPWWNGLDVRIGGKRVLRITTLQQALDDVVCMPECTGDASVRMPVRYKIKCVDLGKTGVCTGLQTHSGDMENPARAFRYRRPSRCAGDSPRQQGAELLKGAALLQRLAAQPGQLSDADKEGLRCLQLQLDRVLLAESSAGGGTAVRTDKGRREFTVPAKVKGDVIIQGAQYGDVNAKDKVLLIMGFAGSLEYWSYQTAGGDGVAPLSGLMHCEVAAFDNRGAGKSGRPWATYTTRELARDAARVLEHLKWYATPGIRLHVVGHSMGGMVAQHLVLDMVHSGHPPETATFITTHTGGWRALPAISSVPRLAFCAVQIAAHRSAKAALGSVIPVLHSKQYAKVAVTPGTTGAQRQAAAYSRWPPWTEPLTAAVPGVLGHATAVCTHRVSDRDLARIGASTRCLVVYTESDGVIPPCHSRHLAVVLQCPTARVPAGHMLMQEAPGTVNAALVAHFTGLMHTHADTATEGTQIVRRLVGVPVSLGARAAVGALRAAFSAVHVGQAVLGMGKRQSCR